MIAIQRRADRPEEPVPSERIAPVRLAGVPCGAQRVGRIRVPITLAHRPWATLYRLPDGTLAWTLRLWRPERAVLAIVSTATLRYFAKINKLDRFRIALEQLQRRAEELYGPR